VIDAVVFDLDGVIVQTEELWNEVREAFTRERGGDWTESAQADMMGMSSTEWSRYLHDALGVPGPPEEISREVVRRMAERYAESLPLIDGAMEAVKRVANRWPLGLASSSNRQLIDLALELSGLLPYFRVTVSSEEVERGKPAPDVYLEAARRLRVEPSRCAAIEDSASGIRSAHAAGMLVVAIPNPDFPPPAEVVALAAVTLSSIRELEPETVREAARLSTASSD
jgi:HAD superfamily hydrolase (TIGR01509 family)